MDKITTSCRNGRRAPDGMKVRKMKRGEEKKSRVLTSLFIRIYQRVKKIQGERKKKRVSRGKERVIEEQENLWRQLASRLRRHVSVKQPDARGRPAPR